MLSDRELVEIIEQASTVWERLEPDFAPLETANHSQLISNRISSWCEVIGDGDQARLRQRLTWDGLDWPMVRRVLGPVRLGAGSRMPPWVVILQEIGRVGPNDVSGILAVEALPAFERIVAPFALTAWDLLATRFGGAAELVSKEACGELLRSLLHDLATLSDRALHLESAIHCARERSSWGRLAALSGEANEEDFSEQFVESMISGGLATFLKRYPVLARLLATVTMLWVDATALLLQRLAIDLPDIEEFLGAKGMLGCVTGLQSSLSDPHFGRRTVTLLTFASGHKLIYKPKNLGMEAAYNHLLDWLNSCGSALPLRVVKVLERPGYGWVQFVAHHSCRTREEIRRYYERAGMMLCLVYVLEGTDCHCENIIASGEHPVLVDAETLCHPQLRLMRWGGAADADLLANDLLSQSVLRTGLLPSWEVHDELRRIAYDISGLGGGNYEELSDEAPRLELTIADRMVSDRMPAGSLTGSNRPTLAGAPARPTDYVESLVAGFRKLYGFLLEYREALSNEGSPLNRLAEQRVRFLYRPTRIYKAILHHVLDTKYLRDGADQSIQLELLARAFIASDGPQSRAVSEERPLLWPMLRAEREALQQGDIPLFAASTDSDSLELATGNRINRCFREASFHSVVRKLSSLNDKDLQEQSTLIRDALGTYCARHKSAWLPSGQTDAESSVRRQGSSTAESFTAGALRIAEEISKRAIRGADRSATWITPQYLDASDRYRLQPADCSLYSGKAGVALFLAAVEKVTGGAGYRELALDALRSLREQVRMSGERLAIRIGIGGCSGLGSIIYAMVRIHSFLNEPLLEDARRAASLITADRIEADQLLDVTGGAAGAIMGLLSLYNASGDEESLERAVWCGRHLLKKRTRSEAGHRTWATLEGRPLTGMAHGAAGIAYSLTRLYQFTGLRCFMEAATEAMAYEASVFSSEAGNWPDMRSRERVAFRTSWCHGAPGIGLSRLGCLSVKNDRETQREVEVAFKATERLGLTPVDHPCCGNLGRAELFLVGGRQLSRPGLVEAATRIASCVLERSEEAGSFGLNPLLPNRLFNPGFFQGTAGIGYGLLRMAHPLPSVLLWRDQA
jgi:type 2 lantibiotic biosynthesis protein LanM